MRTMSVRFSSRFRVCFVVAGVLVYLVLLCGRVGFGWRHADRDPLWVVGLDADGSHNYEEPKTFADYVRPEYR